jgi:hypothetical protein
MQLRDFACRSMPLLAVDHAAGSVNSDAARQHGEEKQKARLVKLIVAVVAAAF